MITDQQQEMVAFLEEALGDGTKADVIETHISRILLSADRAWKTKRAVKLPYVDFSTPQLRLESCIKEVKLNQSTAPGLYIGVRRITRAEGGGLELDGRGALVDAAVEMHRFDQDCVLDAMAREGQLNRKLMIQTAEEIVRFHRTAPIAASEGGAANIAGVLDINEAGFAEAKIFDRSELRRFHAAMRTVLARHAALLDRRASAAKVRRCHGDLHLRNICLLDGVPRLFDCIEFNDRIATVDVLYDLAFLLMDLWHRGLADFANLVANRYLDQADDEDGFVLLPFFMAVRAAVRAHVLGTQITEGAGRADTAVEARSYLDLAWRLLDDVAPQLIAIGGLSGSGKSTVAEAIAAKIGAPPGARIMESDRIRKAMHGVPAETHLPARAYLPEVSAKVYRQMALRSRLILADGGSVVADAVFDREHNRALIEAAASAPDVRFEGIWLEADPDVLRHRVAARKGGSSDATVDVLSAQLDRVTGPIDWRLIDAGRSLEDVVADILNPDGSGPQGKTIVARHA